MCRWRDRKTASPSAPVRSAGATRIVVIRIRRGARDAIGTRIVGTKSVAIKIAIASVAVAGRGSGATEIASGNGIAGRSHGRRPPNRSASRRSRPMVRSFVRLLRFPVVFVGPASVSSRFADSRSILIVSMIFIDRPFFLTRQSTSIRRRIMRIITLTILTTLSTKGMNPTSRARNTKVTLKITKQCRIIDEDRLGRPRTKLTQFVLIIFSLINFDLSGKRALDPAGSPLRCFPVDFFHYLPRFCLLFFSSLALSRLSFYN